MKILHIYKTYFPVSMGGVEQCIFSLNNYLGDHGCNTKVLAINNTRDPKKTEVESSEVIFYPLTFSISSCPFSWTFLREFSKQAKECDVIHYHFPWPFADILHLLLRIKKPAVLTYHSDIVRQSMWLKLLYKPLRNFFFKKVQTIVVTSQNLLATSSALKKIHSKAVIIPIGINRSLYPPVSEKLIKAWQDKVGSHFFISVGVLRYYKGLQFLLEAIRTTNLPLVIVGAGPEEFKLKEQANKLDLHTVHFTGSVSEEDKIALLSLSKAVVSSAHLRSEAFCISLLEGLMMGKPLISTELGTGTSFVNQHNKTGFVVEPGNALALRIAMKQLIEDKERYQRFSEGALVWYQTYFTGEYMGAAYLSLYRKIIRDYSLCV